MARMPAYYIPHGAGPCFFMDWTPPDTWLELGDWLRTMPQDLPESPKALLYISAHWEAWPFTLIAKPNPGLYFDYYGFPDATYDLTWSAPGAPLLLPKVQALLEQSGIAWRRDNNRDFDHGVFVPGKLSFPLANIPTMQISLLEGLDPAAHIALGRALAPLRNDGVLLVGSGMSFHNMRAFRREDNNPIPGAELFDTWLTETIGLDRQEREKRLIHWAQAPGARMSHPREEHLLPLMVIAGAAESNAGSLAYSGRAMGAPLAAYRFG